MTVRKNIYGSLELIFNSNWSIADANPISGIDIVVRQLPNVAKTQSKYILRNKYAILGSSLKGTLRSVTMKLDPNSCNSSQKESSSTCNADSICRTCNIFGKYPYYPSKVRFGSIFLDPTQVKVNKLTHVMIDRRSRSNVGQGLFTELRIQPSTIEIMIEGFHLQNDELNLLLAALQMWGNYGLGKGHTPFEVRGIDELKIEEREEKL